jgi:hypothetical protein
MGMTNTLHGASAAAAPACGHTIQCHFAHQAINGGRGNVCMLLLLLPLLHADAPSNLTRNISRLVVVVLLLCMLKAAASSTPLCSTK